MVAVGEEIRPRQEVGRNSQGLGGGENPHVEEEGASSLLLTRAPSKGRTVGHRRAGSGVRLGKLLLNSAHAICLVFERLGGIVG